MATTKTMNSLAAHIHARKLNEIESMTIPLKQWCAEEGIRLSAKPHTIWTRLRRGKYPNLPLKRINARVVLVELDKMNDWLGLGPITDGL